MKEKIYKIITKINIITTTLLLIITPLFSSYKDSYINSYLFAFSLTATIAIIQYILKPYKLNKKIPIYLLFILTYLLPLFSKDIINITNHLKISLLVFLSLITTINISHLYEKSQDKLNKIVIASITITTTISIIYVFIPNIFNTIGIQANYGDFFLSSIYRLYGTLMYPNSLALFCLIGIILSFNYLEKPWSKPILYINILGLFLTISKSIILFALVTFIIFSILNKKIRQNLLAIILPLMFNLNLYRESIINNNLIEFLLLTTILFAIYLLLLQIIDKNKIIFTAIMILTIVIFTIYPTKPLTIEKNNNQNIFIVDFLGLKEQTHTINITLDSDNFDGNVYLYKHFIQQNNLANIIISQNKLQKKITIKFKATKDAEYYSLKFSNKLLDFDIKKITISDGKNKKVIPTNYYLWPYNYISSLEQTKYDKTSINSRLELYKLATKIIKENPIFGHGFDYFKTETKKTDNINHILVEHAHIMTLGVENGVISIITWIIILLTTGITMIKNLSIKNLNTIFILLLIIYSSLFDFSLEYHIFLLLFFIYSLIPLKEQK